MSSFTTRYKNKKFVKERIELDGHAYEKCEFEGCLIVLEKGETEIKGCKFNHCRLMLLGQSLRIAKILSLFIGDKLGDARVIAIDRDSATLVGAGKTNILSLPE